jgi:hypothetical protein
MLQQLFVNSLLVFSAGICSGFRGRTKGKSPTSPISRGEQARREVNLPSGDDDAMTHAQTRIQLRRDDFWHMLTT